MDVIWAGTFVPAFERNKRLAEYFAAASIRPRLLRASLWPDDRVNAFTERRLQVGLRMLYVYPALFIRLLMTRRPDLYLVSYPGWFDVPVVKIVAWLKRRPLVFDIFISLHDTAVTDRRLVDSRSLSSLLIRGIDRLAMRLSDRIIADTRAHADFLADVSKVDAAKFGVLFLGADEQVFQAVASTSADHVVLFYGNFVPLQGADVIVRAAAKLGSGFHFRLIGTGQTAAEIMALASDLELTTVEFPGPMSQRELVTEIAASTICLGIFGVSPKTDRVVPHKVYEAIACGRAVITADSSAVREVFPDRAVRSVPPGDPDALAAAIREILEDKGSRAQLAESGRARFAADFAIGPQSRRLVEELSEALFTSP